MRLILFFFLFFFIQELVIGQIDGAWQGVLIQNNKDGSTSSFAIWAELNGEGTQLTGKFRSEKANTPYYKVTTVIGKIEGKKITIKEKLILNEKPEKGYIWCFVIAKFVYNDHEQKLKGSYTSYVKGCPPGEIVLVKSNKSFNSKATEKTELTTIENIKELLKKEQSVIGKQFILEDVHFLSSKYNITSSSYPYLNMIVTMLKGNNKMKVHLKGHTDSDGEDEDNFILSQKRAKSVASYFTKKGIEANRISYEGYGESRPIVVNNTDENKKTNRRVEFLIISQ